MFLLHKPTADDIHHIWIRQNDEPFSYDGVGLTEFERCPAGYMLDRHRQRLGDGKDIFQAACEAIRSWRVMPPQMVDLYWRSVPIETGNHVVVGFQFGPLYSLNPCRIVYSIEDTVGSGVESVQRFGFAYGTLPEHVEKGEERFLVTWNPSTGIVEYEVMSFSATNHLLAKIGYPFVRFQQARFRKLSGLAMRDAVQSIMAGRELART